MFSRIRKPEPDAIEVIIGPRASFSGNLSSDTSIRIDGAVDGGRIQTPANVILTETARVRCDIVAKTVSIRGAYWGELRADRVELLEGSQVSGALHVNSFFMDEGVALHAEVDIRGAAPSEAPAPTPRQADAPIPVITPYEKPAPSERITPSDRIAPSEGTTG
ncbi:MAG: polymer-forming cytoskeletal protein [Chloroflexota bacterium]|nr:polymer-forming cytoskeletal protein [Chloroflexota bacterium]